MTLAIAIGFGLFCVLCAFAVLVGLPGIFAMGLVALIVEWVAPELMSWWAIGGILGIAVLGEVIETLAGSLGAKAKGASNRAMFAAAVGGIAGAILGTFLIPIPVVGTVLGSALGAGLAAVGMELTLVDRRSVKHLGGVGAATAIGRLFAVVIKGVLAALACLVAIAAMIF
jgi:uncharacterized protein YqgC (DUF456 family)